MSLLCDEDRHSPKFLKNAKALSLAEELDFEYDNGSSSSVEKTTVSEIATDCKSTDRGDDVEEGEIVDTSDCIARKPCRFYRQGECAFGKYCSFLHISDKGLYKMFDYSPVVCYSPSRRESVAYSRELDFEMVDTSWERTLKEAMHRVKQWDIARQRKVSEKVPCDSKPDSRTHACKSPVRKSLPLETLNETPRKKSVASDPLGRQNFHSAWRDPWRRSPGRKILPSPPTSHSYSSKSHSPSSSPSKRSSRSNRRRRNRQSSSSKANRRSTSSSDSSSPSPKWKRSSRCQQHRRDTRIYKTRHRSTSSCHSSSPTSPRKRRSRSSRRYRDRRSFVSKRRRSTSSSRSLSPRLLMPVAKSVPKRFEKEMQLGRQKIRANTKLTSSRTDAKASPIGRSPKKLEITGKKVDAYPTRSSRCRKESTGKQIADISTREGTKSSSDSNSRWTPKKVEPSSCSDMSISPVSSPLIEIFKPQTCQQKNASPACGSLNKKVSRDVPEKICAKPPPCQEKSSASSSVVSTAFDGKRGKVRKKIDPLEKELMKCNKNFVSMKRCLDSERPPSKPTHVPSHLTGAKPKKTFQDENAIPPSRKEILLKRLEAVNAAIARKTKKSN